MKMAVGMVQSMSMEGSGRRRRRSWLIARREKLGYTREELAALCGCTAGLVRIVEEGGVTHPRIAARLIRRCGLGLDAFNAIVPVERRADMLPIALPPPRDEDFTWKGIARMFRAMHSKEKNVKKHVRKQDEGLTGQHEARRAGKILDAM